MTLKPCPFCARKLEATTLHRNGGKIAYTHPNIDERDDRWCPLIGSIIWSDDAVAVESWNRRDGQRAAIEYDPATRIYSIIVSEAAHTITTEQIMVTVIRETTENAIIGFKWSDREGASIVDPTAKFSNDERLRVTAEEWEWLAECDMPPGEARAALRKKWAGAHAIAD